MPLDFSGLFVDLQDRIRPLRARLFPRELLLELHDDILRGQVLADGAPGTTRFDCPLPALTCRGGMPLEKQPLADLIGDLLVRDSLLEAFVMVALPAAAVVWRVVEWPRGTPLPEDAMEAVRKLDASELRLPFALADAVIDAQPLESGTPSLLVAASRRELVEAWIEVFTLADIQLERMAPAQSCEFLGLRPLLERMASRDLVGLLSPQDGVTRLSLFRAGQPRFERTLLSTGANLVDDLVHCLAFYRRSDPSARDLTLLHSGELPEAEAIAETLGVALKPAATERFDSLILRGLASLEVTP
ncbi:MAG: pilus assembly protein PilM [Cyanobium sp.]